MRILLIYGEKDAGKTTSCHILFNELKAKGGKCSFCDGIDGNPFSPSYDFKAVVAYQDKTIGIYSAGDGKEYVSAAIDFGYKYHCDYLIATVRKGIRYNEPLRKLGAADTCEWFELKKMSSPAEMTNSENQIVNLIINSVL